ncbi:MAG TPA: phenylalanine--tRNA ligase subunit beta [Opitutaceae bacterium]|nr:phenylalanine--tRNA ligase subunit beta [Opitutaceae bacterium]
MKISLNWVRDYAALEAPVPEITRAITFLGFEVEQVLAAGAPRLEHVVVGEVLTRDRHPNADKLSVCTVDIGLAGGVRTIVCGAQNYKVGDRVAVALPGAVLPGGLEIKSSRIRGQLSDGMMCSGRELGIGADAGGLLILEGRPPLGAPINEVLAPGDTVFDIEITPNRPDCLSHLGLARELAAWFRKDLAYPQEKFRGEVDAGSRSELFSGVQVDNPEDCPLYSAHVVEGVRIGPSPAWIQERLRAVGLRPINNVVDVGNYVMLECGQPLHAFDASKIAGGRIVVRRAREGERITTLDGRERTLSGRTLVIADAAKALVVAGVMGGENSGVDESTTSIVLECAIFRAASVRWTSRALGLSSDSSYRYERGVDPHTALEAAWRAIDLIVETSGGTVVGPVCVVGGDVPWKREVVLASGFVRDRLGFEIPVPEMRAALESLELKVTRDAPAPDGGTEWTVSIPSWRDDIERPIDLVEEILRLHGTDRIPPAPVTSAGLAAEDDPVVAFNRRVTSYLVGHDFHECVNLTLRPSPELTTWVSETAAAELALSNPFVEDQSHLRPTLIMGLLDSLLLNQSRGVAAPRLCETGRIFVEYNGQNYEGAAVAFVIAEDTGRHWRRREQADFYSVKHHLCAVAAAGGVDLDAEQVEPVTGPGFGWQAGHSVSAGSIERGWTARFGLVSLAMLRARGIEGAVLAGIFSVLPERLAAPAQRVRYREFSLFPAALRDIALVVDRSARAGDVRGTVAQLAEAAAGSSFSVECVEVFDVYEGKGLPEGKKSLAFSLVFRSPSRTLTDDEVNEVVLGIQREISKTTSYELRK